MASRKSSSAWSRIEPQDGVDMDATEWEQQFEESVARERQAAIDLLDAARAMTGAFKPAGTSQADAASVFSRRYEQWREAADALSRLAENCLARH
jgi:hypothetical protein